MKKLFEKHFERTWLIIFLIMFVFIMIPFPFFYSETYIPAFGGVPLYIFGWIVHTAITFALIIIYYRMCMKRKEYQWSSSNSAITNSFLYSVSTLSWNYGIYWLVCRT